MRYPMLLCPLVLVVVVAEALAGRLSVATVVASALICYGAIASYRLSAVWEARWNELIRLKAPHTDHL